MLESKDNVLIMAYKKINENQIQGLSQLKDPSFNVYRYMICVYVDQISDVSYMTRDELYFATIEDHTLKIDLDNFKDEIKLNSKILNLLKIKDTKLYPVCVTIKKIY